MRGEGRSNSIDVDWAKNAEHVTLTPEVCADGRAWNLVAILPGVRQKYCTLANGTMRTPASFLTGGTFVSYRDPWSMDETIFYNWFIRFA